MDHTICNRQNQCDHTGLESLAAYWRGDGVTVRLFRDNFNQFRAVLFIGAHGASAVLVGSDQTIRFKYTTPGHRGHGYTRQLQAMLAVWGVKWRRSDYQTQAGAACYG